MSRLPTVGGDNGNWGAILNDYLSQEHNPDGSLKIRTDGTLSSGIADGSITASKLSPTVNNYLASAQTAVQTVNGKSGQSVTLAASDISGVATLTGGTLTASQVPSSVVSKSEAGILTSPGAAIDCGALLQSALDSYRVVHLVPGSTYLIATPVFLDAADNNAKYAIYAHGATIKFSENLPVPSGWNTGIAAAPPTGFFNGTLRTALSGSTVDTSATYGCTNAPFSPRFVIYDAILESNGALGSQAACAVFGGTATNNINGAAAGLVNCVTKKLIAGLSWVGYADGNFAEGCEVGSNPNGNSTRIVYQRASGDNTRVVRCKAYGGYTADISGANGFVIENFISGQVNIQTSTGKISVGHQETEENSSAAPWSISIDRSRVSILDHYSWASNVSTKYSIRINDSVATPNYVASEVTIRDWRPVARFHSGSSDVTKGPSLYISALNSGGRIRVANTRGIVLVSGASVGWQGVRVDAADSNIQTALTAGADYIATGNFELMYDSIWRVVPIGAMPASRRLVAPTLTAANHTTATGGLVQGQLYEYVAAVVTQGGGYGPLSSSVQVTADAKKAIDVNLTNTIGPCQIIVWRKAGSGVATAPDAYVVIGLDAPQTVWLDMGNNINGRPWISASVPVPNTIKSTGCQYTFPRVVRKNANEIVNNSSTLQNDDELIFPVDANAEYAFEATIFYDSGTTPDAKFAVAVPTGSTLAVGQVGATTAAAGNSGSVSYAAGTTSGTQPANVGGAGTGTRLVEILRGTVKTASTAGSIQLQWAQANADLSDTTVFAGSSLRVERTA